MERQAIETALAAAYALMTGNLKSPADVAARDLNHRLAQQASRTHITRRQRSTNARFTATLNGPALSALAELMSCGALLRSSGRRSSS